MGISARDDVLERHNVAAAYAVTSGIVAVALCFAGANVGEGYGAEVVLATALVSTGISFVLWMVLELCAGISDRLTIARDPAAGVRLGTLLLSNSLVLAVAAAGDWHGAQSIVELIRFAWPAGVLTFAAIAAERLLRRRSAPAAKNLSDDAPAAAIKIERPSGFQRAWLRALTLLGFRRDARGGFGAVVERPGGG